MYRWAACAWLWVAAGLPGAQTEPDSDALLARITARVRENVDHLPNYVCRQTIERSRRTGANAAFKPLDTLRVEVSLVGNRELYAWPDAERFEERELADMIGRGVIGTGNFALLAKHVFLSRVAEFTWRGEELLSGRRALRFDYDVPRNLSSYKLHVPPHQEVVGFNGSFWVDPASLDLIRLEVHAQEIPENMGISEFRTAMDYARLNIADSNFLLPNSSELTMVSLSGEENRNRARFTGCRRYQSESAVSFTASSADRVDTPNKPGQVALPPRLIMELSTDADIDLETATVGDSIRAVLARPLRQADRVIAPEGATLLGRLLRLEKQSLPFEHYIVGLQFHTLEFADKRAAFSATMEDVSPATGLIRQAKTLNPTFTRRRSARMDILVREQHAGQGVIHWDARHPRIRRGLKMRWLIDAH